ncbi:hypothetical protein WR164_00700 [Philodulcilactobacillus myokoensis]|uniref:Pyrroline-5-carboxylate reductase catalytic N-terminal domain-containing protein n=1 Tax=Philodulcilactobacillus myokoensis TaxID=2929573 RepID=A0A9W6AZE0_9LACO|nr:NAD(P)-binding domain-containing protein [Philodulcilactobacillus myokoensis]GLB46091.1 hypothetical protein WR164_00700 [Philodulcilactobacillus myokoensis]
MSEVITVIGGGAAGSSIINSLKGAHFNVKVGLRSPEKMDNAVSIESAIKDSGQVIILALPYDTSLKIVADHKADLKNKTIIDMMNPIKADMSGVQTFNGQSGAENLQSELPDSHIVETFNHVDAPVLGNPKGAFQFVVSDDKDALSHVTKIANQMGFDSQPINDLSRTAEVENFAFLWIYYSVVANKKADAFLKLQ